MARQFSDKEKAIIRYICQHRSDYTFVLTNVFNQWFDRTGVSFNAETGNVEYDVNNINEADANRILGDENGIIEIALLIKYLVDHGYIYLIKKDKDDFPKKPRGNNAIITILNSLPSDIADIIRQTFRRVFVSYDLVAFVNNSFKTYEDLQLAQAAITLEASKRQIRISIGSLLVSALTLVSSLVLSHCSNCSQNRHNEAMLNTLAGFEANFCAVNNKNTLELSAHIDSLRVSFNQHNTQNVNITKASPKRVTVKKQYNLIQIDTINCDGKQYIVLPIKK